MLEIIYKNDTDTLTLIEYPYPKKDKIIEKEITLKLDKEDDHLIFESMLGDLWLFKGFISFYPKDINTIAEFEKFLGNKARWMLTKNDMSIK